MKKKWFAVCTSVVFLTGWLASCAAPNKAAEQGQVQVSEAQREEPLPEEESNAYAVDWQVVKIPAPALSNNLIQEPDKREISVLLPQSYHKNEKAYPVLYFLNGYGSSHENTAQLLRDAMVALSLEELIVVSVDAISRLNCSFYVNSPVTGNWQDFITKDVVDYIDANYRTLTDASARGIAGHSVGGFGVMNIALNTEGIFDYVYAMSPAIFAPEGFVDYDLRFELVSDCIAEYEKFSEQEAREWYLKKLANKGWQLRYTFDYGSAFAPDALGKAPYVLLPERTKKGEYQRDAVWEQYQNGFGGPPQQLAQQRERLRKLGGLALEYGRQDESVWILNGCKYLEQQMAELEIPVDLRVYDGDHSSKVPMRFISDVLPYFAERLAAD